MYVLVLKLYSPNSSYVPLKAFADLIAVMRITAS